MAVSSSLIPCQSSKALHRCIDLSEIPLQAMGATKLSRCQPKATRGEGVASLQAAEVDDRRESLLLLHTNLCLSTSSENVDRALVKIRRGHFDRMARQSPRIEAIEPTGIRIVPRTFS